MRIAVGVVLRGFGRSFVQFVYIFLLVFPVLLFPPHLDGVLSVFLRFLVLSYIIASVSTLLDTIYWRIWGYLRPF